MTSTTGWRLIRRTATGGAIEIEWRCPTCWASYKLAHPARAARPARVEAEPARESWLDRLSPWRKKSAK